MKTCPIKVAAAMITPASAPAPTNALGGVDKNLVCDKDQCAWWVKKPEMNTQAGSCAVLLVGGGTHPHR